MTIAITMGAIATPLFMLILGGNIYNDLVYKVEGSKRWYAGEIVKFVLVKNIVFPFAFLALLLWLRPTPLLL